MTGYGKNECHKDTYQIVVEMKSVNHRFLDTQIRMPREFNAHDLAMKKMVKAYMTRGRVECFVTVKKDVTAYQSIAVQWGLMDQLVDELNKAETERYNAGTFSATSVLTGAIMHPSLFEVEEKQDGFEAIQADLLQTFEEAVKALDKSREEEGADIKVYFNQYLQDIETGLTMIKKESALFEADHHQRLQTKLQDLVGESVDEPRLLTEVALLIERGDIHEELDRLTIHVSKLAQLIEREQPVGKEMDFLIQEMNREVNTIGSKSTVIQIKEHVVFLKTTIEKIREQVQNIE